MECWFESSPGHNHLNPEQCCNQPCCSSGIHLPSGNRPHGFRDEFRNDTSCQPVTPLPETSECSFLTSISYIQFINKVIKEILYPLKKTPPFLLTTPP